MNGHTLSAGESMIVCSPHDADNKPLAYDRSNPAWIEMDKERARVSVEICYSSTLGECWTLRGGGSSPGITTETHHCPTRSELTFKQ